MEYEKSGKKYSCVPKLFTSSEVACYKKVFDEINTKNDISNQKHHKSKLWESKMV